MSTENTNEKCFESNPPTPTSLPVQTDSEIYFGEQVKGVLCEMSQCEKSW